VNVDGYKINLLASNFLQEEDFFDERVCLSVPRSNYCRVSKKRRTLYCNIYIL
jgi:hypothetical protein